MATRFYINNFTSLIIPATLKGAWDAVPTARAFMMSTVKFGGLIAQAQEAETTATAPFSTFLLRGISSKLSAQTISGDVNVVLGAAEGIADSDFFWHIHIYVTQGDTDLVRGTLLANYRESGSNEWPTGGTAIALQAPPALTPVVVTAGDRLVVEIGFVARNVTTSGRNGTVWYGSKVNPTSDDADDLLVTEIAVTTKAGSINFSQTITFEPVSEQISHQQVQVAGLMPVTNARIVHEVVQVAGNPVAPTRIAHIVVQVVSGAPQPLPDLSGIYYINPGLRHDRYYAMDRKIPNPTVKTALLGE